MHWRFGGKSLYRGDASQLDARIGCANAATQREVGVKPIGSPGAAGERDMADAAYREYVELCAFSDKPSGVILNRSAAHAAVVLEYLFRSATARVRILTRQLSADVYGVPAVVAAAVAFLRDHPGATIAILAERGVDRGTHPLIRAVDQQDLGAQLSLRFVPNAVKAYPFNFAVADGIHYRFEESRENREAIVQFRDGAFAENLDRLFGRIEQSAVDRLP